jgi:excinuclease ABC subunit A
VEKALKIIGAKEHNLKDITVEIPQNSHTVITGVSGSGKSTLAFDTIYAEGQRRYIQSFSPYVRQFFDKIKKPDVTSISNIRPAIALQQKTRIYSSRSTVGSLTGVKDLLRALWVNFSHPVCPDCFTELTEWSAKRIEKSIEENQDTSASQSLLATSIPVKGAFRDELQRYQVLGFNKLLLNTFSKGKVVNIEDFQGEQLQDSTPLLILERFKGGKVPGARLSEALEHAYDNLYFIQLSSDSTILKQLLFANEVNCPKCQRKCEVSKPHLQLFNDNHPQGACEECNGFGRKLTIDHLKCIPDESKTLREGAIVCWNSSSTKNERSALLKFCKRKKIDLDTPYSLLEKSAVEALWNLKEGDYWGIIPWFSWFEKRIYKVQYRVFLNSFRTEVQCSSCNGTRLTRRASMYHLGSVTFPNLTKKSIEENLLWLQEIKKVYGKEQSSLQLFKEIESRLQCLIDLGLPYLTLSREGKTLSGGETQRVNLTTAIGSDLVSMQIVLDEPSVGLHSRDTASLTSMVNRLSHRGNTVVTVEHDQEFIKGADWVIELGPGGGKDGGSLLRNHSASSYEAPSITQTFSLKKSDSFFSLNGLSHHNLKNIDLKIPERLFTVVTGVSGSGKSSVIEEILKRGLFLPGTNEALQVISVTQDPLAKSTRSNIATYTKLWDTFRNALASTPQAAKLALTKSSFSFNVTGGRCHVCQGAGAIKESMQFLSDMVIPCEACLGNRFQDLILNITWEGLTVLELLNTSINKCTEFFSKLPSITSTVNHLISVGLGHLTLGHPLSELSGGEAQRLKLVSHIKDIKPDNALALIFDEPTTGLHTYDVSRLLTLFHELRDKGGTIIVVEHNLDLIAKADWLIDLGPGSGDAGGEIIGFGTPYDFAKEYPHSATGSALAKYLSLEKKVIPLRKENKKKETSFVNSIEIRGAKVHNLKNISLDVPLGEFIALTGVSGSGKSSIAKDIIHAEAQRRYLDCLSPYARQFIKELKKPDVDSIHNLTPTICVTQHTYLPGPLSTVGTMSEVYHLLRLLFAKVGEQFCLKHPDSVVKHLSPDAIVEKISYQNSMGALRILAPIIKGKKGNHKEIFTRALKGDILEVRVDGIYAKVSSLLEGLSRNKSHNIEFVVGKLTIKGFNESLLEESITQALSLSGGEVILSPENGEEVTFSVSRSCPKCGAGYFKPDPEDLSFNSSRGRCSKCDGMGEIKGKVCPSCHGSKLNGKGRNIRLQGKNIFEVSSLPIAELGKFLSSIKLREREELISAPIKVDLKAKIDVLLSLGLGYLTLSRSARTLSSGELQRLRIGAGLGGDLAGALYIFDEPSAGLHPYDNLQVLGLLKDLQQRGNGVLMIEHDRQSILAATHVIDIGPGGGRDGGNVVFSGKTDSFLQCNSSKTASALRGAPEDSSRPKIELNRKFLPIKWHQPINNIRRLNFSLPLNALIAITGVSGAGKSTFVNHVLTESLTPLLPELKIASIVKVDHSPIGRTSRSTPASYLKVVDEIRKLLSSTLEAKARGFIPSHFSYNSGASRCKACNGLGSIRLEMSFLPEAKVPCDACGGTRYDEGVKSIVFNGLNIVDILALTFEEARQIFANHRKIHLALKLSCDLGLGYLTLGQDSSTLSGGESQRLKLVQELSKRSSTKNIYLLDEPTTGLHINDVHLLITALRSLVTLGHTVIVIEHEEHLIGASDYMFELGPGPGEKGGEIIFSGPPKELIDSPSLWGEIFRKNYSSSPIFSPLNSSSLL